MRDESLRQKAQWTYSDYAQLIAVGAVVIIQILAGVIGEGNWLHRVQIIILAAGWIITLVSAKKYRERAKLLEMEVSGNAE